jgi:hypothetical protein
VRTASGTVVVAEVVGFEDDFNRTVAQVSLNDLLPQWYAPIWGDGPWILGGYQYQNVGWPQYQTYTDVDGAAARFLFPAYAYDSPNVGITDATAPWTKDSFVFTTRLTVDWPHDVNFEWFFGGMSLNLYVDRHTFWWLDEPGPGDNTIWFANVSTVYDDPQRPYFGIHDAPYGLRGEYELPVFPEGPLTLLLTFEFTKGGVVRAKVMQEGATDPGWQIYFTDVDLGDRPGDTTGFYGHDSRTWAYGVQALPEFGFRTHYNDYYLDRDGQPGHTNIVAYDYVVFALPGGPVITGTGVRG